MIHPLQLASAMLVLLFATALFAGAQIFRQQQLGNLHGRPLILVAKLPI